MNDERANRRVEGRPPEPLPHHKPTVPNELEEPMEPKNTKPATKSRTVQSGIVAFLVSAWAPIIGVLGIIFAAVGLNVNAESWLVYSEDGQIDVSEILLMVKDLAVAILALLAIKFRRQATQALDKWF